MLVPTSARSPCQRFFGGNRRSSAPPIGQPAGPRRGLSTRMSSFGSAPCATGRAAPKREAETNREQMPGADSMKSLPAKLRSGFDRSLIGRDCREPQVFLHKHGRSWQRLGYHSSQFEQLVARTSDLPRSYRLNGRRLRRRAACASSVTISPPSAFDGGLGRPLSFDVELRA